MSVNLKQSFERWCRLCAEEQEVTIMIFSAEAEAMLLHNKLNNYLLIKVDEDDKLPKNICIKCCTKLQSLCDFIDTVRKAQDTLNSHILTIDSIEKEQCTTPKIKEISESVCESNSDSNIKETTMEVSVDPMMVLQNADSDLSPEIDENNENNEDIVYLNSADGENVTIKLIKRTENFSPTMDKRNTDMKPFKCSTCKSYFSTEQALKNHSWVHFNEGMSAKKYHCSTCLEGFDFKCDLITHLKKHRASGMCQLCGRFFRNEKNLAAHMEGHMSKAASYTCKICYRSYNTRSNLKTHSITHSNERPYKCHLCKKSFKRNQDLKFHINQHTGNKPYKCPFCEKTFASSGNCYSHRSRMHPDKHVDKKVRRGARAPKENPTITPHMGLPKNCLTTVKGIFKYQCQVCEHSFMKRENFTYHMYQHTGKKPFHCTYCTEKFVTRNGLIIHYDKAHPGKDRPLALLTKNVLLK